jgi:hypothetical protein
MIFTFYTRQLMNTRRINEARSRNHFCYGKAVSIAYSDSVPVSSNIKHAKRMRRIILSSEPHLAHRIFSQYLTKGTIFGKNYCIYDMYFITFR